MSDVLMEGVADPVRLQHGKLSLFTQSVKHNLRRSRGAEVSKKKRHIIEPIEVKRFVICFEDFSLKTCL